MGFLESLSDVSGEEFAKAKLVVGVDSTGLKGGLDKVEQDAESGGKAAASGWNRGFKLVGVGVAALATAFIGFTIEGVKKADELDAAIGRIGAQVGLTASQTGRLRSGLLDMSTRTAQGVDELAKSIESVAKAGFDVEDSLRIQEASAKAATVTHSDLGVVTNTVVTAMKAWNIAGKDVNKTTDTLVTTVGQSRIDWDALSRIIATAAPIAKDAGVSFLDLNAAIISIGRSGVPARRAASGVIALMRNLSSPAAQKEMALLGLTVNKTTIAHDGLLLTLQKMEKASGKHVDVIVRNKKGQIDFEKSLKATTKANQGQLQAMQAMTGGAAGLVTADILLANGAKDYKAGQDALNESLGKTNEEFDKVKEADLSIQLALIRNQITRFAIDLGTQVLPYVAQFLGWLTIQLPLALKGIGNLWTTTLKAPVTAMVSSFLEMAKVLGDALFGWGSSGATGARSGIVTFFEGMATLVGDIARDIGGVFDVIKNVLELPFAGAAVKGLVFLGIIRTLVSLLPALSRAITGKFLGGLNLLTGGVFKLGGAGSPSAGDLGARATTEAAAKTSEAAAKTGEAATKLGESSGEAASRLSEAAVKLSEAATKMAEAAEATKLGGEAGIVGGGEGINAAEAIRNNTYVESTIDANEATIAAAEAQKEGAAAQGTAATATERAAVVTTDTMANIGQAQQAQTVAAESQAKSRIAADRTQTAAVEKATSAQIASAEKAAEAQIASAERAAVVQAEAAEAGATAQAAGGLVGLKGKAAGALGSAGGLIGGLISKAVVPLLVAQLASDIIKAPLGGFIASAFGKERLGEKMKEDFFGGMLAAFSVATEGGGSDAAVGRADTVTLDKMNFKTMTLAKLGIKTATFDQLDAPEGTIENAIGKATANSQLKVPDRTVGEGLGAYFLRIRDHLNTDLQVELGKYNLALLDSDSTPLGAKLRKDFADKLGAGIGKQVSSLQAWTTKALVEALTPLVAERGFSTADLQRMSQGQLLALAKSFAADTDKKFGFVQDYLITTALKGDVHPKTAAQRAALSADTKSKVAYLSKLLGKNWQAQLEAMLPPIGVSPGGVVFKGAQPKYTAAQKKVAKLLADKFDGNWQDVIRQVFGDIASTNAANKGAAGRQRTAAEQALKDRLVADEKASLEATQKFFSEMPDDMLQFITGFSKDLSALDPTLVAKLNAKFKTTGDDWITAFRNGADKVVDPKTMAAIVKTLGPKYGTLLPEMLKGLGQEIFAKGGGDAGVTLRKDLAAAIRAEIAMLTPKDLTGTGKKPESSKAAAADRKLVTDFLTGTKGTAALALAISTDGTKAKDGYTKLGDGLKKAIPDAATRNNFINSLVALQKAAQTPGLNTLTDVFKTVPSTASGIHDVGSEIQRLGDVAYAFLQKVGAGGRAPGTGGHGPDDRGGSKPPSKPGVTGKQPPGKGAAAGGIWDANSVTHGMLAGTQVTYGEAGNEMAAIISHPKTASWASIMGNVGSTSRLPGTLSSQESGARGGNHQTLHVGVMHVQSQSDEQAILDTLEFMAPGGIA